MKPCTTDFIVIEKPERISPVMTELLFPETGTGDHDSLPHQASGTLTLCHRVSSLLSLQLPEKVPGHISPEAAGVISLSPVCRLHHI